MAEELKKQFLQSLIFPGLDYKFINPLYNGVVADPYGAKITSGSLVDYILTAITEPGLYTAYVDEAVTDIPDTAKNLGGSLKGLINVSQLNESSTKKCCAYIILIDQESNFYVQYIKDNVGCGWKEMKDGHTPVKGMDYWTAADKQEIVSAVLEALPDGTEVSY